MHYFLLIRLQRQQPTHRQSSMGSAERTNRLSRNRLARCAVRHAIPARY